MFLNISLLVLHTDSKEDFLAISLVAVGAKHAIRARTEHRVVQVELLHWSALGVDTGPVLVMDHTRLIRLCSPGRALTLYSHCTLTVPESEQSGPGQSHHQLQPKLNVNSGSPQQLAAVAAGGQLGAANALTDPAAAMASNNMSSVGCYYCDT